MSPKRRSVARQPKARASNTRAGAKAAAPPGQPRWPYLAAIGLSAFLLFSLELLAGRLVLPAFGGSPGVWTTALCFFTALLFVGYAYAHFAVTRLKPATAGVIQLVLALVAVGAMLFAPTDIASLRIAGVPEAINVLYVLLVVAGPPAFVLASTTPLLSAWFATSGRAPWWLYAVSNGASFAALLTYPLLVEPLLGLSVQRTLITLGLAGYVLLLGLVVRTGRRAEAAPETRTGAEAAAAPARRRQLIWLLAAAVPAGLLSATTNFLQTDLVAAPFIWIGPLAMYLASFVVAFSDRGRRTLPAFDLLVPVAATFLWMPFVQPVSFPPLATLLIELGSFFILAVAIHGRLALDRPGAAHLTRFYLVLSAGGAIATAFVALAAPLVFTDINEYPLLIVAAVVALAALHGRRSRWLPELSADRRVYAVALAWRVGVYGPIALALYLLLHGEGKAAGLFLLGAVAVVIAATPRLTAIATIAVLVAAILVIRSNSDPIRQLTQRRDFFGVVEVATSGNVNAEYHGTTLHGLQFTDDKARVPTSYYARSGPLGAVFDDLRLRAQAASIGIVGLGAGTVAAYAQPTDKMTFFEIDHQVIDIARDPAYFTFLSGAPVAVRIVEGDGRLSLAATPAGSFDLLILDAFSSDAVPPHLLTAEAMRTYARTLRPGGVMAFNLSNRYYELVSPVVATAQRVGLDALVSDYVTDEAAIEAEGAASSRWVIIGALGGLARFEQAGWLRARPGPVLTDDYPDLTRVLQILST